MRVKQCHKSSPSHHHFYRWYGSHSQSWVVYGIVLTIINHGHSHEITMKSLFFLAKSPFVLVKSPLNHHSRFPIPVSPKLIAINCAYSGTQSSSETRSSWSKFENSWTVTVGNRVRKNPLLA